MPYRRAERPAGPARSWPTRRSDDELRALAREVVTGLALCTGEVRAIRSAFYMMTAVMDWSTVDTTKVAALIGYMGMAVPGRAMNGYPIFTSMGMLHVDDVEAYDAHLKQMTDALA